MTGEVLIDGLSGDLANNLTNVTYTSEEGEGNDFDYSDLMPQVIDGYYYYDGDIENILEPWNTVSYFIPSIIIFAVTFIVGVAGNSMVIFVMVGDRKSRSVTTLFLVSLAAADLFFLLICVPCELIKHFLFNTVTIDAAVCKVVGFIEVLTGMASVLNLMAVSIERYVVIIYPMKARSFFTMGSSTKILIFVWALAIIFSAPTLHVIGVEYNSYFKNHTRAGPGQVFVKQPMCVETVEDAGRTAYAYYLLFFMFIIPTFIMTFCYACVIWVLWLSTKELAKMTGPAGPDREVFVDEDCRTGLTQALHDGPRKQTITKAAKEHSAAIQTARKQVIKMLITVVIIFLLAWGPKLILNVMIKHELTFLFMKGSDVGKNFINLLPYIQSCLNPIVYGFMSSNFRRSMRYACRTYICRNKDVFTCLIPQRERTSEYEMDTKTNGTTQTAIPSRYSPPGRKSLRRGPEPGTETEFDSVNLQESR